MLAGRLPHTVAGPVKQEMIDESRVERRAMRLPRLIFLLALLIGVSAAAYSFFGGDGLFRREIGVTPEETRHTAEGERSREQTSPEAESVPQPEFDIVRVEETGEVVAAGTAPPGWTISIETDTGTIGKVTAEFDGSWVWTPDTPLPAGDYSIGLRARAPDGAREIVASQRVAVSVSRKRETAVVAVSEDDKPTRVLQSGVTAAQPAPQSAETGAETAKPSRDIAFSAVDYTNQQETGRLSMSGIATPGARIAFYLDNRFIGSAQADDDGAWQFSLTDVLASGEHALRADHVDMASGEVLSRAEVRFDPSGVAIGDSRPTETRMAQSERKETAPAEREAPAAPIMTQPKTADEALARAARSKPPKRDDRVAAQAASPAQPDKRPEDIEDIIAAPQPSLRSRPSKQQAAPEPRIATQSAPSTQPIRKQEPSDATSEAPDAMETPRSRAVTPKRKTAIVVRRGDTLWHIAEQYYGSGVRYTQIFRTNRDQIRNPHRIYPGQQFDLPK